MLSMNTVCIGAGIILTLIGVLVRIIIAIKAQLSGKPTPKSAKFLYLLLIAGIVGIIAGNSFTVVPTGYTGVKTTFGLIDEESCMPGFNAITPFVQKINLVNNKQQDLRITNQISGETDSETVVYMDNVVVTYAIVPESSAWIYAHVDNWVEQLIDEDLIGSACRSATRQCQNDTVTDRGIVEPLAKKLLQEATDEKYGPNRVEIKNVIIVNMTFEESYETAIGKKSAALQEQQEQAIRNQIDIDKAEALAESERRVAQGEADAEEIRAKGKAEANKILSESITAETQKQDMIDKWDGALPRATGDDMSFGLIDILTESANKDSKPNQTVTTPDTIMP